RLGSPVPRGSSAHAPRVLGCDCLVGPATRGGDSSLGRPILRRDGPLGPPSLGGGGLLRGLIGAAVGLGPLTWRGGGRGARRRGRLHGWAGRRRRGARGGRRWRGAGGCLGRGRQRGGRAFGRAG